MIPCGVDPARFPPGAPEPGRVLAVGRLVEKKAPHLTVRAFARAAAAHSGGAARPGRRRAAARPLVEAAIAETGMGDRVTLHGALGHDACGDLMRRAAIFVQHSVTASNGDTEGFPVVDRRGDGERAAGGLDPAQRHPRGRVEHGETGLLVAEGDVDGMGAALARLLADPALAAKMGAAGRARALESSTRTGRGRGCATFWAWSRAMIRPDPARRRSPRPSGLEHGDLVPAK